MSQSFQYFATCPKGMSDLLQDELQQLGAHEVNPAPAGVAFAGDLVAAYRVCLWSRLASRILLQLAVIEVNNEQQLYDAVQTLDWSQHLDVDGTLAVSCQLNQAALTNSHYASLKVKDAVVDQFAARFGRRPSVDRERPDVRINVFIDRKQAHISLDLSGEASHRRGYRAAQVAAPMKENLAVAVLLRAGWPHASRTLADLMCGSGTLLIEAALMALNIAPGLERSYFGFSGWKQHDAALWQHVRQDAQTLRKQALQTGELKIFGFDQLPDAVAAAQENVRAAGLEKFITVEQRSIQEWHAPLAVEQPGLVVINPPYGERLGDIKRLAYVYADLGDCLKHYFAGWQVALLTGNDDLAKQVGLRAHKTNTLYNGAIQCSLLHYRLREMSDEARVHSQEKADESRAMFVNRLKKNHKHLAKWAQRNSIECYRVYDADLPEFAAAIDCYADWVLIQEYAPPATVDLRKANLRMRQMIDALPEVLEVAADHVVIKTRQQQKGASQYEKEDESQHEIEVHESGLGFYVNLQDYLDTGLFLDHRITRGMIRDLAKGKRVLNLFAYTGTASVYAVAGGATKVTTVDMSNTYLSWARRNFRLNHITFSAHEFIQADCMQWLRDQPAGSQYDLIFLDPPTFSNSKRMEDVLDVQRDHAFMIEACMKLLSADGVLVFSTNFRKFKLDAGLQDKYSIQDISAKTLPEDFKRNLKIHMCWMIRK